MLFATKLLDCNFVEFHFVTVYLMNVLEVTCDLDSVRQCLVDAKGFILGGLLSPCNSTLNCT